MSIGIAPTKTLAKVASKRKKYPKLKDAWLMYRPEDITKGLTKFPIGDVWGIGRRYSKMLKSYGIETAEQFRQMQPEWVKAKMSIVGLRTWKVLHGEHCIEFEHAMPDKQSITVSRSFAKPITEIEPLQEVSVDLCDNGYREDQPQHREGRLVQFSMPMDSTLEVVKAASKALKELYRKGYGDKKAGVILYYIAPNTGIQSMMFDEIDRPKHKALMQTIDSLNAHHGRSTVALAPQGTQGIPSNRDHLSSQYTSVSSDILVVKI